MEINNLNKTDEISPLQFSDEFIDQTTDQDELPIQLTNITGTNLQEINDDCLLKIFKSLTLIDLCSIAKTCERFQQVALRVFPKEFSISKEVEGYFVIASRNFCEERRKREDVERILETFGFCAESSFPKLEQFMSETTSTLKFIYRHLTLITLHLDIGIPDYRCNQQYQHILQIIGNSCKELEELVLNLGRLTATSLQPLQSLKLLRTLDIWNVSIEACDFFSSLSNLEKLKISHSKIPKILTTRSKPIFKRLQLLNLFRCSVEDWTLFAQCDSLVELKLRMMSNCGSIVFPKLERFTYSPMYVDVDVEFLLAFISRHKALKTLVIYGRCYDSDIVMILEEIGDSCKELEQLRIMLRNDINITAASIQPLKALKSLRNLELLHVTFDDFRFFASLTNLRELHLSYCDLPKNPEQFDFLVQLIKLAIVGNGYPDASDVVGIISRLTKLEEFAIKFVLDEKTFSRIVGIVKRRSNVLTLQCDFYFDLKNFYQNERVRLIKRGLLK